MSLNAVTTSKTTQTTETTSTASNERNTLLGLFEKNSSENKRSVSPLDPGKVEILPPKKMPKPDLNFIIPPSPSKTAPPMTPRKTPPGKMLSTYQIQHASYSNGMFFSREISFLAQGSFSNVYTFKENQKQFLTHISNDQLVIKAFHGIKTGFDQKHLDGYLQNSIENYNRVRKLGLRVATIYNSETAAQDRYIVQKRIPNEIDFQDPKQIEQIQTFFTLCVTKKVAMDLQPQNFKAEDGLPVYFDNVEGYVEENPKDQQTIQLSIGTALKAWQKDLLIKNKDNAQAVLSQLTKGFLDNPDYPEFTTAWLESILDPIKA